MKLVIAALVIAIGVLAGTGMTVAAENRTSPTTGTLAKIG